MKVFTALWMLCLAGFIHCGDDEKKGVAGNTKDQETQDNEPTTDAVPFAPTQPTSPIEPENCVLDLSDVDLFRIDVSGHGNSRFKFKEYRQREGFNVVSVVDKSEVLWISAGRRFNYVDVYSRNDYHMIVVCSQSGKRMNSEFFECIRGSWNWADGPTFSSRVQKMMLGRDPLSDDKEDEPREKTGDVEVGGACALPEAYPSTSRDSQGATASITVILNLANLDLTLFKSFDYIFAQTPMRLIVPQKGIAISRVVNNQEDIWIPGEGEKFDHSRLYLDNERKPVVVLVVMRTPSGITRRYYKSKDGKWEESKCCYDKNIGQLKAPDKLKGTFVLNVEAEDDSPTCRIFEVELLGITTKHFFPKPDFHATEVRSDRRIVWKTLQREQDGTLQHVDYCISLILHKRGAEELLEVTVQEEKMRRYRHFKKVKGGWKGIDLKEFFEKFNAMCT